MRFNSLNRSFLQLSLCLIIGIGMFSCEKLGLTAPKMDTPEAIVRVQDAYKENVDTTKYKPIEIRWYELDALSNDLIYLNIQSLNKEDNKIYSQSLKIGGDSQNAGEMELSKFGNRNTYDFDNENWIHLSDINSEVIMKQIENAKSLIPEEYAFESVGNYVISRDTKTKELKNTFDFRVTQKGESKEMRGRQIITNYYEFSFTGFLDGTVEMHE